MTLAAVAQDGMRVRASAGAASYRRRPTLERFLDEAEAQVATLKAELDDDPAATSRRVVAARERAATERAGRVRRALDHLPELEAAKRRVAKPTDEARASTTDPEARVMKMATGRPTTCSSRPTRRARSSSGSMWPRSGPIKAGSHRWSASSAGDTAATPMRSSLIPAT